MRLVAIAPVGLLVTALAAGCRPTPAQPAPVATAAPVSAGESAPTPASRLESPSYTRWARHPLGTAVTVESVTEVGDARSTGTTVSTLAAVTDAAATVTVVISSQQENEPMELSYSRWMVKPEGLAARYAGAPIGTYATAEEAVTVRGKLYKCQVYRAKGQVEAGPTETTTWLCDEVPGGMVKSVHRVPAVKKTVTTELVSVSRPGDTQGVKNPAQVSPPSGR